MWGKPDSGCWLKLCGKEKFFFLWNIDVGFLSWTIKIEYMFFFEKTVRIVEILLCMRWVLMVSLLKLPKYFYTFMSSFNNKSNFWFFFFTSAINQAFKYSEYFLFSTVKVSFPWSFVIKSINNPTKKNLHVLKFPLLAVILILFSRNCWENSLINWLRLHCSVKSALVFPSVNTSIISLLLPTIAKWKNKDLLFYLFLL